MNDHAHGSSFRCYLGLLLGFGLLALSFEVHAAPPAGPAELADPNTQRHLSGSVCGDGILDPGEECDDGDEDDEDACNNMCELTNEDDDDGDDGDDGDGDGDGDTGNDGPHREPCYCSSAPSPVRDILGPLTLLLLLPLRPRRRNEGSAASAPTTPVGGGSVESV